MVVQPSCRLPVEPPIDALRGGVTGHDRARDEGCGRSRGGLAARDDCSRGARLAGPFEDEAAGGGGRACGVGDLRRHGDGQAVAEADRVEHGRRLHLIGGPREWTKPDTRPDKQDTVEGSVLPHSSRVRACELQGGLGWYGIVSKPQALDIVARNVTSQ